MNMAKIEEINPEKVNILETRMHYWSSKDPEAMSPDKKCIVCGKRNMDWPRYSTHLENAHELYQVKDQPSYQNWDDIENAKACLFLFPISPNPRLYDSVNEEELSEFNSTSGESDNEEEVPKLKKINLPKKKLP